MMDLSYSADQVRRYDHDRYMTAIFAPVAVRENLFALYAFNIEIAKTGEVVTEALIGQIRLQWWRDTLDRLYAGDTVAHAVARPLGEAIAAAHLERADFDRLIDSREFDLDRTPPADFTALHDYADGVSAPLLNLAIQSLGGAGPTAAKAARQIGIAWALTGLLRAVPFHARQRRLYLPADELAGEGVRVGSLFDLKPDPGLPRVIQGIGQHARQHFLAGRDCIADLPRHARSPALLAELGLLYLADLERAGWNPFVLEAVPGRRFTVIRLALKTVFGRY
jgi:phytoene synthase